MCATKISKTTPCKVAGGRRHSKATLEASGKSGARLQNHAIEKRPIDLSVVALEVLADFSPSALDSGIELALERIEVGPFIVQGVEAAIRSTLANLVGNALIHAQGAKRVAANLRRGSISIHDDGAGFLPYRVPSALIEPFQTGGAASGGAGLGLSIVREIMAAHGGELVISSRAGHGTTMCLRFPEATEAEDKGVEPAWRSLRKQDEAMNSIR
jgi:signal transduction histidine kinase